MVPTFALHQTVQNRILSSLPGEDLQRLKPYLTRVRLVSEQVLIEYRHPPEQVFFVEEGIVLLVACASWSNPAFQIAMIGPEGLVGCQSLLGVETASFTMAVVKMPGLAYRMNIHSLREAMQISPRLNAACLKATDSLLHQVMQTAVFNASNMLEQRCVRWLLMAHDRIEGDNLLVTHESISGQLGVRRSGITLIIAALQQANFIRVSRGRITILDRPALERIAGPLAWTVDVAYAEPKRHGGTMSPASALT